MFSCSPNTVVRAYQTLERDDVIYPVPKSGYYLVEGRGPASERTETEPIDFASTTPRGDFLPFQEMEHCLRKAISLYKEELFGYTDPKGISSLRNELSRYFHAQQMFAKPDQIAVVTGAQQAFSILTRMPFPGEEGRAVLVEQPTYFGFLAAARVAGCPVIGIHRDEHGIDLEVLESYFCSGQIKLFYTVPRFLNPLGTSYSLEQKRRIADLARSIMSISWRMIIWRTWRKIRRSTRCTHWISRTMSSMSKASRRRSCQAFEWRRPSSGSAVGSVY
ncbi:Uncharacterized HTH-type transcriptional regulator ydcR [Actinobacillus pleuropneumoniae]|nr:Uncharacterized HTH-type transcriptional regulator ydcR [Actinobacillus pleuropneumoniae]